MGSVSGLGRSHLLRRNKAGAPQLLNLRPRVQEPQLLSPCAVATEAHVAWSPCSKTGEAPAMRAHDHS